ncbi:hypothetical protein [uncultured Arcticibacterium sp.]|uniref:hypothetical protein n=1 Tax=uncultured Arcticibacterium sp. TaxID=2173042 RepID=UPI0030FA6767
MKTSHLLKTFLFLIFTIQIGFAQSVILTPDEGVKANKLHDADNDTRVEVEQIPDNDKIRFHIKGKEIGVMDTSTFHLEHGYYSLFIGKNAGINNYSFLTPSGFGYSVPDGGHSNVGIGYNALRYNTTGPKNTALGSSSLRNNLSGSNNTAFGNYSLFSNIDASENTGVGSYALTDNTTGEGNSALGYNTLKENTSGQNNTAIGFEALRRNEIGNYNSAIGHQAGNRLRSGSYNLFLGTYSGASDTLGNRNVYIGYKAGALNQYNSFQPYQTREGNVFIGNEAGGNETRSNRLYIENSSSQTPLIYGNFEDDSLKVNGNLEVTENVNTAGFTQLGEESPAIKLKTIIDTSPASQNGTKSIPHGLNATKIINVSVYINSSVQNWVPPNYHGGPNYEYDYYFNSTNVVIKTMVNNSANVIDKPLKILITYTQ